MIILFIKFVEGSTNLDRAISSFDEVFKFRPFQISIDSGKESKVKILKSLGKTEALVQFKQNLTESNFGLVVLTNQADFKRTELNQRIFFMKNFQLFEKYHIGDETIINQLGHFTTQHFIPNLRIEKDFTKRRGNFHQKILKFVTNKLNCINIEEKTHQPNSEHFEIIKASGPCINLIKSLEEKFNFTARIFTRVDGVWGMPIKSNGTWKLDGIVKDLSEMEDFDFGIGLAVLLQRSFFIDFLHPFWNFYGTIFIKSESISQAFDFQTYVKPFENFSWLVIFSTIIIFVLFSIIIQKISKQKRDCFLGIWTILFGDGQENHSGTTFF